MFIFYENTSSPLLNIGILKYKNEDSSWILFSIKKVP